MPYSSGDIPSGTEKVPAHGQSIYRAAFNSAYEKLGEERAHAIAWAAVKHKFKKKGEKWVSKDSQQLPDFWSEEAREAAIEAKKAKAKEKPGSEEKRKRYEKASAEYEKQLRENGENHPKTVAAEREMLKAHREYGVVHRGERGGKHMQWSAHGYHDGDLPGHPFRGNQHTSGSGGSEGPDHTGGLTGSGGPLQSGSSKITKFMATPQAQAATKSVAAEFLHTHGAGLAAFVTEDVVNNSTHGVIGYALHAMGATPVEAVAGAVAGYAAVKIAQHLGLNHQTAHKLLGAVGGAILTAYKKTSEYLSHKPAPAPAGGSLGHFAAGGVGAAPSFDAEDNSMRALEMLVDAWNRAGDIKKDSAMTLFEKFLADIKPCPARN